MKHLIIAMSLLFGILTQASIAQSTDRKEAAIETDSRVAKLNGCSFY